MQFVQPKCILVTEAITNASLDLAMGKRHTVHRPETIQRGGFTSFGQPTRLRLITCANYGNHLRVCSCIYVCECVSVRGALNTP